MSRFWKWLTFHGEGLFTPLHAFVVIVVLAFVIMVGRGCQRQYVTIKALLANCEPTNFYVTESRGDTNRVYDCPEGWKDER